LESKNTSQSAENHRIKRSEHWNKVALKMYKWEGWGGYYHRRLSEIYSHVIPAGANVLELGCGNGELLAALNPNMGVGVDFSPEMVALASNRYPKLSFIQANAEEFSSDNKFDFVILSDILNEAWDVQELFENVKKLLNQDGRLLINVHSRLWELPLTIAVKFGLAKPGLGENWLTVSDIDNLLNLSGFDSIKSTHEILFPFGIPLLAPFFNKFLVRFWPFNHMGLTNFIVARPQQIARSQSQPPIVSVIVPARNEAGNIENILARVPEMGSGTEIVFVEGNSTDNTWKTILQAIKQHPEKNCQSLQQTGKGKGDADRLGFSKATGEILMILDADLTVPPEDLPRFYDALVSGKGDFINGVRLIYPMEEEAMRFFNLIGNKFFSLAFSWLLGQPVKDTLCGTKVLWKKDYKRIADNRHVFGDFDPFGDFDLLFGAARLNFKIVDLPIRYRARTYGSTNIERWKHGWLLLRMVAFAARRIKFI
jgi:SAM-dependent methyltransferase